MSIKRRYIWLVIVIFILTLEGCTHSGLNLKLQHQVKSGKDLTFYITTDIHYLSKDLTDDGDAFQKFVLSGAGKQLDYIDETLSALTYDINKGKPDILIISGDLTNNGEKKSHLDLAKKLSAIEKGGTSVYIIPGNHDILNPWARSFKGDKQYVTDNISDKDFSKIYEDFGYGEAISRDKNTLSYLAAPSEDFWLLMLDTNQYKNNAALGSPQTDGRITQETFDWIKKCSGLAKEKGAKIITVMHHSLLNHSDVIREGYTINDNEKVIDAFDKNNLDLVLSGHIHVQDISSYKKGTEKMYDIATGSLAVYPHLYGILKYSHKDASLTYSTSKVDVEDWSKKAGIEDKTINHFSDYSKAFFGKLAYVMAYKELNANGKYSSDDVKAMCETIEILNLRYFAGTEYLNAKDVIYSKGYKLWTDAPEGFFKSYVKSILEDKDTDDNNLQIKLPSNKH